MSTTKAGLGHWAAVNWRNTTAISRRELGSVLSRPLAYIFGAIFLVLVGWLFSRHFGPGQEASMRQLFLDVVMSLSVVIPILTMPLISEELNRGTIETMMTAPITETQLVLGKFFGVFTFYLVLLLTTLVHMALLSIYGAPELGQTLMGYAGMLLVGAAFVSVGLFFSSLTRDQLLAAILSAALLVAVTYGAELVVREVSGWLRNVVAYLSAIEHFKNFAEGKIVTRSLVYFLSATVFFLFITIKVVESRRWR